MNKLKAMLVHVLLTYSMKLENEGEILVDHYLIASSVLSAHRIQLLQLCCSHVRPKRCH